MLNGKKTFYNFIISILISFIFISPILAKEKLWNTSLTFDLDYSLPFGDFFEEPYYSLKQGVGFEGSFYVGATDMLEIGINVYKSGSKPDYLSDDYDIDIWRYNLAARIHMPIEKMEHGKYIVYGTGEM
ncbi:MAG: hypothetical protein ABIJ45_04075, partial [Candidatus Zixiibacteriota bacterium]